MWAILDFSINYSNRPLESSIYKVKIIVSSDSGFTALKRPDLCSAFIKLHTLTTLRIELIKSYCQLHTAISPNTE